MNSVLGPALFSYSRLSLVDRRKLLAIAVLRTGVSAIELVGVAMLGVVGAALAAGISNQSEVTVFRYEFSLVDGSSYFLLVFATALIFMVKSFASVAVIRMNAKVLASLETKYAQLVFGHYFGRTLRQVVDVEPSRIIFAIGTSAKFAFGNLLQHLHIILVEGALLLGLIGLLFLVSPLVTLAVVAYFALVFGVFQYLVATPLKHVGEKMTSASQGVSAAILDFINCYREVKSLDKEQLLISKFRFAVSQDAEAWAKSRMIEPLPKLIAENALLLGVSALMVWQVSQHSLEQSLPTIAIFLGGGLRLMAALLPVQNAISRLRIENDLASLALEIVDEGSQTEIPLGKGLSEGIAVSLGARERTPGSPPGLEFREVAFQHPDQAEPVLTNLNFQVASGEFLAIIGRSGAGKTTIADLLAGLIKPTSGTILIDGESPERYRQLHPGGIHYLPQKVGVISGSLETNVCFEEELDVDARKRVREALSFVGLEGVRVPTQSTNLDSSNLSTLSGGQLQRLGFSRLKFLGGDLVILDEPSSALDSTSEKFFTDYLESLRGQKTLIVIAHRLSTIQRADRVLLLDSGKVTADGKFADLKRTVPAVEEYVRNSQIG